MFGIVVYVTKVIPLQQCVWYCGVCHQGDTVTVCLVCVTKVILLQQCVWYCGVCHQGDTVTALCFVLWYVSPR